MPAGHANRGLALSSGPPQPASSGLPAGLPPFPGGSPFGGTGGGFGAGAPPIGSAFPQGPNWGGGGTPGTGGGFGATPPGMPGTGGGFGASPPPLNNTVTPSANLTELQNKYRERLGADPTKRAIDRTTSQIRDATSGLLKEAGANAARRGIGQSGVALNSKGDILSDAQRRIAGASADITMGRERDLDALVMGGLPIMGAQDELGLRKQGLGLQQWQAQNQAEIARQQLGLQAQAQAQQGQQAMMNLWSQYLNMFR